MTPGSAVGAAARRATAAAVRRDGRASGAVLAVRSALAAALIAIVVIARLTDVGRVSAIEIVLTCVAATLLALTGASWWRTAAGLAVGWLLSTTVFALRDVVVAGLVALGAHGGGQTTAVRLVDLACGVVALIVSGAALLATAGALRVRRRSP